MVKMSRETALEYIRNAQLAEFAAFGSDVIDPLTHLRASDLLQHLERQMRSSPLKEFEGAD